MVSTMEPYASAILALGVFGALYLVQLVAADITAIVRKHTPGMPLLSTHDDFLFRAVRAHANTSESVGAAILIAGFAIAVGADPGSLGTLLWVFVAARVVHMAAYYANIPLLRSAAFAVAVIVLFVVFGTALSAL